VASIRREGGKEELLGMYETKLEAALAYTREHATAGSSSREGSGMGLDAVEGDRHGGNPREEQARMLGLFLELVRVEDKKYPGVYHALVRAMELCAKELKTPEACLRCVAEALNGHQGLAECFEALLPGAHELPVLEPTVQLASPPGGRRYDYGAAALVKAKPTPGPSPKEPRPANKPGPGRPRKNANRAQGPAQPRPKKSKPNPGLPPPAGPSPPEAGQQGGRGSRQRVKKDYASMAAGSPLPADLK